jgi:hypothetical protein
VALLTQSDDDAAQGFGKSTDTLIIFLMLLIALHILLISLWGAIEGLVNA